MLSNLSFLETFGADYLEGEEQYLRCQFYVAVNVVKRLLSEAAMREKC
ncbi:unnamed protein product [Protopolystoma xenopodis]|uniref:VPS9 domain-containing protein n=1 Tax=Protopolystoma xenopodis TaxID=117903 RepID=A0A448XHE6_9PLAT|nr:unnamed protein product [Protopolystoma xenopodis]